MRAYAGNNYLLSSTIDTATSNAPPASTEAQEDVLALYEDHSDKLSCSDYLDINLNNLSDLFEFKMNDPLMIKDESSNNNPDPEDESGTLKEMENDNNMIEEIMVEAPFEEMLDIVEVQSESDNKVQASVKTIHSLHSPSLDRDAETHEVGHCEVKHTPTKSCKKSDFNGYYHITRDTGTLHLRLKFTDITLIEHRAPFYLIRAVLFRKNEEFKHFLGNF